VSIGGHYVPGGTEIGITPSVVSYDGAVYGGEIEEFRPERWLEVGKEKRARMEGVDLMFGRGESGCIGKGESMMSWTGVAADGVCVVVALALLYKVVAVVFANFNVEVVDREGIREVSKFAVKWRNVRMRLMPL
jgi:hypothetical protein